jgi:hypothetical protein
MQALNEPSSQTPKYNALVDYADGAMNMPVISSLAASSGSASVAAATSETITIKARDSSGHIVTDYLGTVHFTSSDPQAILPADYMFQPSDAGVHTFTITLETAGTQTVTATDVAFAKLTATKGGLGVTPIAATSLSVIGFPSTTTAGVAQAFTVTALDPYGNVAPSYTGTVQLTSNDPTAALPANYTFTGADAGVHAFTATLKKAGSSRLITATDTTTSTITGTAGNITVNPGLFTAFKASPFSYNWAAGSAQTFGLVAQDTFGNVETGYTGTVHFTSTDARATLPADYTYTAADAGFHNFSASFVSLGSQTLTTTDVIANVTSNKALSIYTLLPTTSITVAAFPNTIAGAAHTFTVTATDLFGNTVAGYTGIVHFTSSDPSAALPADYTFTASDAGVHTFNGTLFTAGTQSITASDALGLLVSTQSGIVVSTAYASTMVVTGYPAATTAGTAHNLTVTVQDQYGNTITNYAGTVHFTSTDPQAVLPADYTFTPGDAGVHTYSATLDSAGTQTITARDKTTYSLAGTESGIAIRPATAKNYAIGGLPPGATAGTALSFTVTAQDAYGNTATGYTGTAHFTSTDADAVLPADYTFRSTDAGVASFNASLVTAGTQSITATDRTTSTITGTQPGIKVTAAALASLTLAGFPSTTAGVAHSFTVTATDLFGNAVAGYTGTIHFTSTDPLAALPADYTFTASDAGVHTYSATLDTSGAQSITVGDKATSSLASTESGITISPAAAKSYALGGLPSGTTAGAAMSFTVAAKDAYGNTVTGYTGTAHFTSSDAHAVLPADYTFKSTDAGVATFNATLVATGTQSITATDQASQTITGTQSNIKVTAAAPASLTIAGFPNTTAGAAHSFTVMVTDLFGNMVAGYTGTIHFNSTDPLAALPADYTFTASDAGVHTFSGTLFTAGTQSITATDAADSLASTQSGIGVSTAYASMMVVTGYPAATAGTAHSFTVTVEDQYGNTITNYAGTVHFTSTDPLAVLPADYTFLASDAGVHTYSATLDTAGAQSITARDKATYSLTGTESGIAISPAAAKSYALGGLPSGTTAGVALSFTVAAKDAYGNTVTGYTGTAHFTSTDANAVLPADYTFRSTDAGVASFNASPITAGTQSITAADQTKSTITGTQSGIKVSPGTPAAFTVAGFPNTPAGSAHCFTVTTKDSYGNVVVTYTGTVHFTSTDPQAVLPADYTFTAADKGSHTFNGTLYTAATQAITATDSANALTSAQSGIVVSPGAANNIAVTGWTTGTAGAAYNVTAMLEDKYGNAIPTYTGTVHFTSSDPKAVLPADYTFSATDKGTHTFSVTLFTPGTQSITVTDKYTPSYTGTESGIAISPAAATSFVLSGSLSTATAGAALTFTVTAYDAYHNVATGYTGTVHFTSTDIQAALPADYTFSSTDGGSATFLATLKTAGTQSITATDAANPTLTATEAGTSVSPASFASFTVAGFPATVAGAAQSFTVTAVDQFGNRVPNYVGTVHFTSTDSDATLPADYTFSALDLSQHTFRATLFTSGTQSITATDTFASSSTGTEAGIVTAPAATAGLAIGGWPSTSVAGSVVGFTVSAVDAYGNVTPGYTGTVQFTSPDAKAILPANYTFTATDAGTRSFSATFKTAGTQTLTAADAAQPAFMASSSSTVTPAGGSRMLFANFPSAPYAGTAYKFTVSALDCYGNVVTGYTGTVHFTSTDPQAVLPADYTFTAADAGTHSFMVTLNTVATETITVTDTVNSKMTSSKSVTVKHR